MPDPSIFEAPESRVSLRVMTFNLRNHRANDGENHWNHRREHVIELIRGRGLDVLGVQEAYRPQVDELLEGLPEFGEVGVGREDGVAQGEHSQLFYRKDRFAVREHGTFWFSDTPESPNSTSWGNRLTRICTWARLEDGALGRSFYAYNLHLDHESQPSRERSVGLLLERVRHRQPAAPALVMGDFNAGEDNPAIRAMVGSADPVLRDAYRMVHPDDRDAGTFHEFRGGTDVERIDFLFATPEFEVLEAAVLRDHRHGRYPSDHYPVFAALSW